MQHLHINVFHSGLKTSHVTIKPLDESLLHFKPDFNVLLSNSELFPQTSFSILITTVLFYTLETQQI